MDAPEPQVNIDEKYVSVPISFVEAVANIGIDFGYRDLEDKWIEFARRKYEAEKSLDVQSELLEE